MGEVRDYTHTILVSISWRLSVLMWALGEVNM